MIEFVLIEVAVALWPVTGFQVHSAKGASVLVKGQWDHCTKAEHTRK